MAFGLRPVSRRELREKEAKTDRLLREARRESGGVDVFAEVFAMMQAMAAARRARAKDDEGR